MKWKDIHKDADVNGPCQMPEADHGQGRHTKGIAPHRGTDVNIQGHFHGMESILKNQVRLKMRK